MSDILLCAINARYSHTSFGIRYLRTNLKELEEKSKILEFTIKEDVLQIAQNILQYNPKIIAFGVYIWNALNVKNVIDIIKKVNQDVKIILGGPEVSFYPIRIDFKSADFIIQGEGEISFYQLSKQILNNQTPQTKIIKATLPNLKDITLPYSQYTDEDIKNRVIYVETSRGCPFGCEFCLSSLDERVRYFDVDKILIELEGLWQRGVRRFKFVDRTFNLKINYANKIIDFFLAKTEPYSIHLEAVPDNFPARLKQKIKLFPPLSLQLEIGLQSLNPAILTNISRKMDIQKALENIKFLEKNTNAHLHLDLIIGLPGESIASFANNLNMLKSITDAEIQLGILKKLSGAPISRWDKKYNMIYCDKPPYEILQNNLIDFNSMQELKRFARYWDIVYNSGNFNKTKEFIWKKRDVFSGFLDFSRFLYQKTKLSFGISLDRVTKILFEYLIEQGFKKDEVANVLLEDFLQIEGRSAPKYLKDLATNFTQIKQQQNIKVNKRQRKRIVNAG
jgi:radical SAM superfamily enzyme YgiQ (UPF0313 family)